MTRSKAPSEADQRRYRKIADEIQRPKSGPGSTIVSKQIIGRLVKWIDEKHCGFIKPLDGGVDVFCHESAMREPLNLGDAVVFDVVKRHAFVEFDGSTADDGDRLCAAQVRRADQSRDPVHVGVLKMWKGSYGFIAIPDGKDIYCRASDFTSEGCDVQVGDAVCFKMTGTGRAIQVSPTADNGERIADLQIEIKRGRAARLSDCKVGSVIVDDAPSIASCSTQASKSPALHPALASDSHAEMACKTMCATGEQSAMAEAIATPGLQNTSIGGAQHIILQPQEVFVPQVVFVPHGGACETPQRGPPGLQNTSIGGAQHSILQPQEVFVPQAVFVPHGGPREMPQRGVCEPMGRAWPSTLQGNSPPTQHGADYKEILRPRLIPQRRTSRWMRQWVKSLPDPQKSWPSMIPQQGTSVAMWQYE